MCTRYIAAPSTAEIARLFDARLDGVTADAGTAEAGAADAGDGSGTEMFPGRSGIVIGRRREGGRGAAMMRWGIPPPPGVRAPIVNVRNLASPFWRPLLANPARRCLVPVSRFAEWGSDGEGRKQIHWFGMRDAEMAAFAGIWRPLSAAEQAPAQQAGGSATRAFAFLTCAPNPLVGAVHPKAMPVILHEEDYDRWLDAPIDAAVTLAAPYPSQLMEVLTD